MRCQIYIYRRSLLSVWSSSNMPEIEERRLKEGKIEKIARLLAPVQPPIPTKCCDPIAGHISDTKKTMKQTDNCTK